MSDETLVSMGQLEALLMAREGAEADVKEAQARLYNVGQAIERYMRQEGAQERTAHGYRVTYKPGVAWLKDLLTPLKEAVPFEKLVSSGALVPGHTEVVPDFWNATKLKPLARYSANAARIIEGAQDPTPPTLKVEKVK